MWENLVLFLERKMFVIVLPNFKKYKVVLEIHLILDFGFRIGMYNDIKEIF
jgi:hypothetical protein